MPGEFQVVQKELLDRGLVPSYPYAYGLDYSSRNEAVAILCNKRYRDVTTRF